MSVQNRANLKAYFTTGEVVTQDHMDDFIDSSLNPDGMTMGFTIDNSATVISTGAKGYSRVIKSGNITAWTLRADPSTSTTVTIKKCSAAGFPTTSSIVDANKPTLTAQTNNTSSNLSGWTTTLTEGDYLEYNVDTNNNATKLALEMTISVP